MDPRWEPPGSRGGGSTCCSGCRSTVKCSAGSSSRAGQFQRAAGAGARRPQVAVDNDAALGVDEHVVAVTNGGTCWQPHSEVVA